jgi:hypothetical protein
VISSPSLCIIFARSAAGVAGPLREGGLGGRHRGMHFGLAAGGHFGQHLLVGRVDGLETLAALHGLAVDQMGDAHLRVLR